MRRTVLDDAELIADGRVDSDGNRNQARPRARDDDRPRARLARVSAAVSIDAIADGLHEIGRAGARDDGTEPELPAPHGVRHGAAAARRKGKVLICLFQRGAADALNVVVPHGERGVLRAAPEHRDRRGPRRAAGGAIDLDGFFGLHPSLAPFKPLWDRGLLAPVHAVGSPSSTRSHFDAQDYMETARPTRRARPTAGSIAISPSKGTCDECNLATTPFRAVAMTPQTPRILEGPSADGRDEQPRRVQRPRDGQPARAARGAVSHRLAPTSCTARAGEMFEAVKMLRAANPQQYAPQNGADYPTIAVRPAPAADRAARSRPNVGLEIAFADVGGWDTHVNQGAATGQLAQRLDDFSRSIAALVTDLGDRMDDVVILTMSEFGRTARAERQRRHGSRPRGRAVRDRRRRARAARCTASGRASSRSSSTRGAISR